MALLLITGVPAGTPADTLLLQRLGLKHLSKWQQAGPKPSYVYSLYWIISTPLSIQLPLVPSPRSKLVLISPPYAHSLMPMLPLPLRYAVLS